MHARGLSQKAVHVPRSHVGLVLLASFMAFSALINTVHFSVGSKSSLYFLGMMLIVGYVAAKFDLSRSPEVLNQHQVGSIADQPAVENRLAIW